MSFRIEDNKKWSNIGQLLDGAEDVVRADMATWESSSRKNDDGTKIEGFNTPFGWMPNLGVRNMTPILVQATKKNILKKYGRSKYNPHQGVKECARRTKG